MHEMIDTIKEDRPNNRIWVGDFDDAAAKSFVEKVLDISSRDEDAPIMVLIDSDGGKIHSLISMIGVMDSVPNPFITVAVGRAFSAGAVLLAHGDARFASPLARIMIHESSAGVFGHIEDGKTGMAEWELLNKTLLGILSKDMKKPPEDLMKLLKACGRDVYLSADDAVKHGIIDNIGLPYMKEVPVVNPDFKYEVGLLQNLKKPSMVRQLGPEKPVKKAVTKKKKKK